MPGLRAGPDGALGGATGWWCDVYRSMLLSVSKLVITLFPEGFSPGCPSPLLPFYPSVFAGPPDAGEVAVASVDRREFGVCRKLIVGMSAFFLNTGRAEDIQIKSGELSDRERGTASVTVFL